MQTWSAVVAAGALLAGCSGGPTTIVDRFPPGLEVVVTMSGPTPDPNGYTVKVDGKTATPIPGSRFEGKASFTVKPGDRTVALTGLPQNCTVESDNPVTVTAAYNESVTAAFTVTCS